ncbi:MAG: hypothetical protein ACYSU8_10760, partial [Planctomycetota bacterium]
RETYRPKGFFYKCKSNSTTSVEAVNRKNKKIRDAFKHRYFFKAKSCIDRVLWVSRQTTDIGK